MSRAYTLSNDNALLVGVDERGYVRDVYFPRIGLENHVSGKAHRVGVYVDGKLRWLEDASWDVSVDMSDETLAGTVRAHNSELGVTLTFFDIVYNEKDIFLREITVRNDRDHAREIRLFFGHEFRIWESARGDTALYDPRCKALIHYKGRRAFLMNARCAADGTPFDQYTAGIFEIEGKAGSYKDAEDGELSGNPIEHGSADSIMRICAQYEPHASKTTHYWLAAARYIEEAHELNRYVLEKTPAYLIGTASDYWRAWVNRQGLKFQGLPERVVDLFNKSLLVTRAHVDGSGAIIASSDSDILNYGRDNYSYAWPRDGAYAARALTIAGDFQVARTFFDFCNKSITEDGYQMHKYLPDYSIGSSWHPWIQKGEPALPIQEDETAIVLIILKEYYDISRNIEFIEEVYNSLIKRSADFMLSYMDDDSGLPHPSYDLWEQKYGISTYTCATVTKALDSAAYFAKLLGKNDHEEVYATAAEKMRSAILTHLYDEERGSFHKLLWHETDGSHSVDPVIDISSVFGVFKYDVLPIDDARLTRAMETLERELMLGEGTIGGMPRYVGDGYLRQGDDLPSNPWTIATLWRAQYYIARAESERDLDPVLEILEWVSERATRSGMLSEQVHPHTGVPVGATPLVWSHAQFAITIMEYLQKLDDLGLCDTCYPLRRRSR